MFASVDRIVLWYDGSIRFYSIVHISVINVVSEFRARIDVN